MDILNEGRAAFYAGAKAIHSPYSDLRRSEWVKGWYDAQHDALVSKAAKSSEERRFWPQPRLL